jgi:hypothetical protein
MRNSIHARFFPTQLAGPTEKGMKAAVLWMNRVLELKILGSNASRWSFESQRSGMNDSEKGEK